MKSSHVLATKPHYTSAENKNISRLLFLSPIFYLLANLSLSGLYDHHLSVFVTHSRVSDMAVSKVVALFLLFALVLTTGVFSDFGGEEPTTHGSASEIQLEQLHAKIHALGFASFLSES